MRDNNSQIQTLLLIIWRRHNILFEWSLANCNWDDRFKTCGTETDFICVFVYLCICVFAFVCLWFQRILLYKYRANVVCARGRDGSFKTSGIFEHRLSDNSAKSELTHLFLMPLFSWSLKLLNNISWLPKLKLQLWYNLQLSNTSLCQFPGRWNSLRRLLETQILDFLGIYSVCPKPKPQT